MDLTPEIVDKLNKLENKYEAMGQDLNSYLDGLLYADYLTYWNYVNLDALLSLQQPKTPFPDEMVFIVYHQITELYFKLCLHEMDQLSDRKNEMTLELLVSRMQRMNNYFKALTHSFDIMIQGMDKEEFLKFRMSLLPASGFQSAQYRMVEICATSFYRLVDQKHRDEFSKEYAAEDIPEMFKFLYWKAGATELASGKKTLTLKQFEKKYRGPLIKLATEKMDCNIWSIYKSLSASDQQDETLRMEMRQFDVHVNVNWPLAHYKSAVRYLQKNPSDIAATGGTNWQKYLPPRFQKRIFYPDLWSAKEMEEWGRGWVESVAFSSS